MKKLFVVLVFCLAASPAWSLTFKKDGSVVQADGTVVTRSVQERYAEALADFRAGNDVSGFPTARKSGGLFGALGAKSSSPSGFFGNDIVEEGAPLIPLPKDIDLNDPIASIAENLGMSSQQFTAALVSSASDAWLEDNGISKQVVPAFDQTVDEFLAAEDALDQLTADGLVGVNATGLTAADIRAGALDDLLSDPDSLLDAAPVLIGAPVEVQRAFKARAEAVLAEAGGIDISSLQTVELGLETDDIEAIAEAAEAETQRLIGEGLNAVNGTELTVQDVIDGRLDATIGIDTAIVNASEEVYAAYEERINAKLAEEAGISLQEIEFVNQAVLDAGVSSAEEAGRVAAEAATRFQNSQGAVAMDEARRAADEAQSLAQIASELEKAAIAEGTEDAKAAAEEAAKAAEQASEAARVAGEAAMAATEGIVARTAEEAAWEAASQNAYEQAISAARAAGASAEEAAAQAAEAAASAGQAAFEAAALAAGQSAEDAAKSAAAEAAEQSALRDLERRLQSGEISQAEFDAALNDGSIPDGG
ncbi:MAG: hypothetical protein ACON4I_02095 [Candidatus Puniceispirillaceae bacterium]